MNDGRYEISRVFDEILATSWARKLAKDLAEEIESCAGDKLGMVFEMPAFSRLRGIGSGCSSSAGRAKA